LAVLPNGDLVAGGFFNTIDGVSANSIARFNGTTWSPLGTGMGNAMGPRVSAMTVLANGNLVAAGRFGTAGGVSASNIAQWNGTSWASLGTSSGSTANGVGGFVTALAVRPDGELFVGGNFANFISAGVQTPTRNIARWSSTTGWRTVGAGVTGTVSPTGITYVRAMTVLSNGDLIFGGEFASFNGNGSPAGLARFNGTSLTEATPLGGIVSGEVLSLQALPDGSFIAAGSYLGISSTFASSIARYDGVQWTAAGTGVSHATVNPWRVNALTLLPSGQVAVGGQFDTANSEPAGSIALWTPPAPPAFASVPASRSVCPTGSASFSAELPAGAQADFTWQFRSPTTLNAWVDIVDDRNEFFGTYLFDAAGTRTSTLSVSPVNATWSGAGEFRVQAATACGTITSPAATLTACVADFNCSGTRDVSDIFAFLSAWFAGNAASDINTTPGTDVGDIFAFLSAWFAGC
ncbi:MAG: hypothetical protein K2Q20_13810, partial [Phycisphaerales bacterium]|nr:hypothetical protein [Phycisphaerales bacterium]